MGVGVVDVYCDDWCYRLVIVSMVELLCLVLLVCVCIIVNSLWFMLFMFL